jgi:hypothetical protein
MGRIPKRIIFVEDLEWIDDYPIINEKLRLSKSGKLFLDLIVKDQLNESQEVFLRGCQHYFEKLV